MYFLSSGVKGLTDAAQATVRCDHRDFESRGRPGNELVSADRPGGPARVGVEASTSL